MSGRPRRARRGDPKRAIGYLRVSTDDQRLGPEAQRASIEDWAAREGVSMVAWHLDQGVSGDSEIGDRPGLNAALDQLKVVNAGYLVVAKRDRLARHSVVAGLIEIRAHQNGGSVMSADGVANGDRAADIFLRSILNATAAYDLALIRQRTKDALAVLKAQGKRMGCVAYGFSVGPNNMLVPHPGEQAIIAHVRGLRAEGVSLRRIVQRLELAGFVSRSGKPLGITQVAKITHAA